MPGAGRSIGSCALRRDRRAAVERPAERIDDAAEQPRADRHAHDVAGAAHDVAGFDAPRRRRAARSRCGRARASGRSRTVRLSKRSSSSSRDIGQAGDQGDAVARPLRPGRSTRPPAPSSARGERARRARSSQAFAVSVDVIRHGDQSATMRSRSARQLLLTTRCGTAQFEAGDQRGIDARTRCRRRAERLGDHVAAARLLLVGVDQRRGADDLERSAAMAASLRFSSGRARIASASPSRKRRAHRGGVETRRQPPGDLDRECGRPARRRPRSAPARSRSPSPRAPAASIAPPPGACAAARRVALAPSASWSAPAARIASRFGGEAGARCAHLGGAPPRPAPRLRLGVGEEFASAACAALPRSIAATGRNRRTAREARRGRRTLTVWRPSVHQSMVHGSFQQRIGEQQQQRDDQAVDRHGLDHRQADEQGARDRAGRLRLAGDRVHRRGDGAAFAERRADRAEGRPRARRR